MTYYSRYISNFTAEKLKDLPLARISTLAGETCLCIIFFLFSRFTLNQRINLLINFF